MSSLYSAVGGFTWGVNRLYYYLDVTLNITLRVIQTVDRRGMGVVQLVNERDIRDCASITLLDDLVQHYSF